MGPVRVTAHQAAQIYRELRGVDAVRRRARRARPHARDTSPAGDRTRHALRTATRAVEVTEDLTPEVALQSALLLIQPYLGAGGAMSVDLARLVTEVLDEDVPGTAGTTPLPGGDPALEVTAAATRVVLRASLLTAIDAAVPEAPDCDEVPQPRLPRDDA
jgi:hypothetical protein